MRKQPTEDQQLLVRAITAAARELGAESPLFPQVVAWFIDNVPALAGLFGDDCEMFRDIQYLRDPALSRDAHIASVMERYGYQPDDLDAVRKRYDRWQKRCEDIFSPEAALGEVLWGCIKHLYPPPRFPDDETESFYV